jgi:hypothetical protein
MSTTYDKFVTVYVINGKEEKKFRVYRGMYLDHLFNDVFREDGTNSRKITTVSLKILEHFYD